MPDEGFALRSSQGVTRCEGFRVVGLGIRVEGFGFWILGFSGHGVL